MKRKTFAARLLITILALLITAEVVPGIYIVGVWPGLWAALILGLVNVFIKPIFTVLTLPFSILTLGLFLFIVNGLMFLITAALVSGFAVSGIGAAVFGSIVLSFFTWVINQVLD